jgi:hypothetical protein
MERFQLPAVSHKGKYELTRALQEKWPSLVKMCNQNLISSTGGN